jgi:Putative transmembrane protein (PGPGW)
MERPAASGLHQRPYISTSRVVITREQWRKFMDQPWVEWGLFAIGVILIILGVVLAPLPGPGGIFLIAPGLALILKTSMWAKRHYVKFKRWQPKAGRWTDWALQRRSAKRREAIRKSGETAGGS